MRSPIAHRSADSHRFERRRRRPPRAGRRMLGCFFEPSRALLCRAPTLFAPVAKSARAFSVLSLAGREARPCGSLLCARALLRQPLPGRRIGCMASSTGPSAAEGADVPVAERPAYVQYTLDTLPEEAPVVLDRAAFSKKIRLAALVVPAPKVHQLIKGSLKPYLAQLPRVSAVRSVDEEDRKEGDGAEARDPKRFKLMILRADLDPDWANGGSYLAAEGGAAVEAENGASTAAGETEEGALADCTAPCKASGPSAAGSVASPTRPPLAPLLSLLESDPSLERVAACVQVGYSQLSAQEVLSALLPAAVVPGCSFETVGHLAHLNLRDEALPYRSIIGQVVLDKNPHLKTVVTKVGVIHARWRTYDMAVLAGEPDTVAEVRQSGARFRLDASTVYWNSRLEREHERLCEDEFAKGQVLLDACAGVGPFAIPAAKRGLQVFASDLNPDAYAWLKVNVALNGCTASVAAGNYDAREAIRKAARGQLDMEVVDRDAHKKEAKDRQHHKDRARAEAGAEEGAERAAKKANGQNPDAPSGKGSAAPAAAPAPALRRVPVPFHHVVMNLPATAMEFLDAFNGAFPASLWPEDVPLPTVHVYTFAPPDATPADLRATAEGYLGGPLDAEPRVIDVRNVAPNKHMYRVSFRVPRHVCMERQGSDSDGASPDAKRPRRDDAQDA